MSTQLAADFADIKAQMGDCLARSTNVRWRGLQLIDQHTNCRSAKQE